MDKYYHIDNSKIYIDGDTNANMHIYVRTMVTFIGISYMH